MGLRLGFFPWGSGWFHSMVFIMWVLDWGFLVRWELRYRLLWFGGQGVVHGQKMDMAIAS